MPEREVREAPGVEHRRGDHRLLARLAAGSRDSSAATGSSDFGLRARGALRRAGRARGEDRSRGPARPGGTTSEVSPRSIRSSSVGSFGRGRRGSCQATKRLRRSAGVREDLGELLVVDRAPCGFSRLATSVELRAGERRVEEQRVRAELRARDHRVDEAAVVAAHDRRRRRPRRSRRRASAWASAFVRSWTSLEGERAELVDDRRLVRDSARPRRCSRRRASGPSAAARARAPAGGPAARAGRCPRSASVTSVCSLVETWPGERRWIAWRVITVDGSVSPGGARPCRSARWISAARRGLR